MDKSLNKNKYGNAILFFVKYCNNQYLGATKLNKLLYYLDFISFRDRGKPVTNDVYIHKQYGPVPSEVDEVLTELHSAGSLGVERILYKDSDTFKYETKISPDEKVFDAYEKKLLESICNEFSLWSTEKIVGQTHLEAPWFYSKPLEKVDFNYSKDIEFFPDLLKV